MVMGQEALPAGTSVPAIRMPALACDCHFHIYDARFPYEETAALKPPHNTNASYLALRHRLGLSRGVVVQPTSFGVDNRPTLLAVQEQGASHTRAVVVIDTSVTDAHLQAMHEQGARGIRINAARGTRFDLQATEQLVHRIKDLGWHLDLHVQEEDLTGLSPWLQRLPVPVVLDHFARVSLQAPQHTALLNLLDTGKVWVKLSAPYLVCSAEEPLAEALGEFVRPLLAQYAERLLWGSDWPHPGLTAKGLPTPDLQSLLNALASWCPSEETLQQVLAHNPGCLYDF